MRKTMILVSFLVGLGVATGAPGGAGAETLDGQQTYDLLFRQGTLDQVAHNQALSYSREVVNALKPEAATRDTGQIVLSFDEDSAVMARLEFRQDGKHRGLGQFPASVGNPMIMYFYESVIRDMAESAGGSPFYIRNRVKEALVTPSEAVAGEAIVNGETVPVRKVTLRPFEGDPNVARMMGFGDLSLEVTMSDKVPGWYVSLEALVPGEGAPVYHSVIGFDALEGGQ